MRPEPRPQEAATPTSPTRQHQALRATPASEGESPASFAPRPTRLSDISTTRRQATRPDHARDARFAGQFDDDTLFFDAVRSADGRHAILLGPALFNLAPAMRAMRVRDAGGGPSLAFELRQLDRHAQVWVAVPPEVEALTCETGLGRFTVPLGRNRSELFAGRRVLLTRSRDNPLPWIADWLRFNRDVNGADAVLFYDNDSSLYTLDALRAAIGAVAGYKAAVVARWPFKYGPQGLNATDYWDSDFCELGAWEHARWTFLARARSVLTGDIDELAFGQRSVFATAERSAFGVVRYAGRWVVGLSDHGPAAAVAGRRHRDYDTVLKAKAGRNRFGFPVDANRCAAKWTAVPARCPPHAQWRMHTIKGWPQSYWPRRDVTFGHFRPINTSWKYERDDATAFDPGVHEHHAALAAAMARVDWSS